jgi:hypothetical protein
MERCWERWERQESKQRNLDCNMEQMEEKYNNGGRNKRKNPEDDYKETQCIICHYCSIWSK